MAGGRRKFPYDLAVVDAEGRVVAVFEAKRRPHADAMWARKWREAMLEGRHPVDAPTFLVLPDHIFRWPADAAPSAMPDWSASASPLLGPYFTRLKIPPSVVTPSVFESIVEMWLQDLVHGTDVPAELAAVRGGEVVSQVTA